MSVRAVALVWMLAGSLACVPMTTPPAHDVVDVAFPSKVAAVVRGEVAHLPVTIATTDEAIAELVEALRKAHDKTYEK